MRGGLYKVMTLQSHIENKSCSYKDEYVKYHITYKVKLLFINDYKKGLI